MAIHFAVKYTLPLEHLLKQRYVKLRSKTACLINNAVIMLLGQSDNQDAGEFSKMLQVNVEALLNGMQIMLTDMKSRQCGTIY